MWLEGSVRIYVRIKTVGRGSGLQMGSTSLIGDGVQSSCQGAVSPLLVWKAVTDSCTCGHATRRPLQGALVTQAEKQKAERWWVRAGA